MPVITISRQFGALGLPVGRKLAEKFGAEFLDRAIVAQVAVRSGIPESQLETYDERLPSIWQRLASALGGGAPEIGAPPSVEDEPPAISIHERLVRLTRAVVEEAAEGGNAIIVGRGGAFILKGKPGVLNVALVGSHEDRVRYLLSRVDDAPDAEHLDERALRSLCKSIDAARAEYIRGTFGTDWMDARNYDLAIDTGRLGVARTVELIEAAVRADGPRT
jgi:cytidylate kinase